MSLYFTIIFLFFTLIVQPMAMAQALYPSENKIAAADQFLLEKKYEKAITIYEKIYDDNKIIARKLGECYFMTKNYKKAKEWLLKANVRSVGGSVDAIQKYAIILHLEGQNEKAISFFGRMLKIAKEQSHLVNPINNANDTQLLMNYFNDNVSLKLKKPNWNTKYTETKPSFYKNNLLYLSTKYTTSNKDIVQKKDVNFLIRENSINAVSDLEGNITTILNKIDNINDVKFYNEGNSAIITIKVKVPGNVRKDKLKRKITNPDFVTQIYSTHKNASTKHWSEPQPIHELNSFYYSIGQVDITDKGDYMVFSSDQYGGYGSTDLYQTRYINDKWTKPKNLGPVVNSKGSEMYPFIYASKIYFASNYKGFIDDDLDIFRAYKHNDTYVREPLKVLNTNSDDFGLIFKESLSHAYFVSNRDGSNDIYEAKMSLLNKVDVTLAFIDNKTRSRLKNVEVKILDENLNYIASFVTGVKETIKLNINGIYYLEAYKEGYFLNKNKIKIESRATDNHYVYKLYSNSWYHGFVGNQKSKMPVPFSSIAIENLNTRKKQFVMTTENGHYQFQVEPLTVYKLIIRKNDTILSDFFFSGVEANAIGNNVLTTSLLGEAKILAMKKKHENIIATLNNDTIPENVVAPQSIQKNRQKSDNPKSYKNDNNVSNRAVYEDGERVYTPKTSSPEEIQEQYGYNPNIGLVGTIHHKANGIKAVNLNEEIIMDIKSKMIGDDVPSNLVLKIISSTEAKGNKVENKKISDRRAIYLRNKFFLQGLPMAKIFAIGVGESVLQNECHRSNNCSEKAQSANRVSKIFIQPY